MISGKKISPTLLPTLVQSLFAKEQEVYETYSKNDQKLRKFESADEVLSEIELASSRKDSLVYLAIYYPNAKGYTRIKKIDLDPRKCNGAKTRYSIQGWGLVHFQIQKNDHDIVCNITANSEKRALAWFSTHPELETPELWSWKEVNKQLSRLKRVLNKST